MLLAISVVLALLPLFGIVLILKSGSIATVDGLFMSLILLAMSGIVGINVLMELTKKKSPGTSRTSGVGARAGVAVAGGSGFEQGKVENVSFYESNVGQPNKSVVTLNNGARPSRMLVFEGDLRNSLPVGKKVEITFRENSGHKVLLNVDYF